MMTGTQGKTLFVVLVKDDVYCVTGDKVCSMGKMGLYSVPKSSIPEVDGF